MTRGPPPRKGLGDAMSAASARGAVMRFVRDPESHCDFLIRNDDKLILVNIRKALRLNHTLIEMEREFSDPIMWLRSLPSSPQIIKELWAYSRRGIWRFFRIEHGGIVEICQDGTPLKNPFVEVIRTVRGVHARKKGSVISDKKG
jgi:hypothetical protein